MLYLRKSIILIIAICTALTGGLQARQFNQSTRNLSVADGIPQSYISGIIQDKMGFIWIGTRDGLAKYDGRSFSTFRYQRNIPESLSSNIIEKIYLCRDDNILIGYEEGEVDLFNVRNGKVVHLSAMPEFQALRDNLKSGDNMFEDTMGRIWALSKDGRIFNIDYKNRRLGIFKLSDIYPLGHKEQLTGIYRNGEDIILVLDNSMLVTDINLHIKKQITFTFENPHLYQAKLPWKDSSPIVSKAGKIIIPDDGRLIIYTPEKNTFRVIALPKQKYYKPLHLLADRTGNILVSHDEHIFLLDSNDELKKWDLKNHKNGTFRTALYLDRSGVLWAGTNGYGIQMFDLYLHSMPQQDYNHSFSNTVMEMLGLNMESLKGTFFINLNPYYFRWTTDQSGGLWFGKASLDPVSKPEALYYKNGKVKNINYKFHNPKAIPLLGFSALAVSPSGKVWGVDNNLTLVSLDTSNASAVMVGKINTDFPPGKLKEVVGVAMDGEETFWICTSLGLIRYNIHSSSAVHYLSQYGRLHPLSMTADKADKNILWIGTYSDGLIKFNKRTGEGRFFTMAQGLPNNTIYSVIQGDNNLLWCSSNKGILAFNRSNYRVSPYQTAGVRPIYEFNRFHSFRFPDGKLIFGASNGYTSFYPGALTEDAFEPPIAFTDIIINNAQDASADSAILSRASINYINSLELSHDKNTLAFKFAALQYNIPEKLEYRYRLQGLNKKWVFTGNNNTATYTNLEPGRYTLLINATNTSGKWSSHIRKLTILIHPPYWQTWWFRAMIILLAVSAITILMRLRIKSIRNKDRQKMLHERESNELEALVLKAQMNPHFIFNCLNSIKALIQENEKSTAISYLTTFSKLIRSQLNNAKKEISLREELETIRLYLELEALRFKDKIRYEINTDPDIDLFSVYIPPLLLQPFVENAIIHGILPLDREGNITIRVFKTGQGITFTIEDNGIGRQQAELFRNLKKPGHDSKGTLLTDRRLKLHNALNAHEIEIETIDKMTLEGTPAGTLVKITLKMMAYDD